MTTRGGAHVGMPVISTPLACERCSGTNIELEAGPRVDALCRCGHRFPHPDQSFARDVVRGRERIDLDHGRG